MDDDFSPVVRKNVKQMQCTYIGFVSPRKCKRTTDWQLATNLRPQMTLSIVP